MLQTYLINIISKQQFENIDAYLKQTKIEVMILNITSHEINIKFSVNYKTFTLNSKMLNVIGFAQEINKTAPVIKKLSVTVPKTLYIFNQVQNENTYNSVDDTINIKVENLNNQKISFNWYVNELSKDESINNSWALDVNAPVLKIPYNFLNHAGTWYFTPVYEIDNQIHVLESITVEVVNKNNLPTISVKNDNVYTNQNVQILLNNTEFLKGNKYLYTLKENIAGSWYTINSTNSSNTIFYTAPSNSQVIQLMVDIQKVNADGSLSSVLNTNTINLNILSLGKLTISAPNQTIVDSTIDLKNINSTVKIVSQLLNSPILKPLYQWQTKNINNIWINIDGQTQPTLDINGINNQSWSQNPYTQSYRLVLTSSQNPDNYLVSNTINVTNPNISIGNVNVLLNNNQLSVNSNNSSIYNDANVKINAPFTLEAQVNDSSFPLNLLEYQWQILNPNGNWQNILGANYKTYTFTPKTYNPHQYRCQVSVMNDWDVGITYSKVVNITVPVSKATQEKYLQELEDYYGIYPETTKNGIISVRTPTEEQLEHQNELLENYFSSPTGLASIYDNLWYNYTALGGGEWKNIPNSLGKWMSNYQLIKVGTQPNGMVYIQLKVIKPHTDMYFSYSNSNGNTINQYFNEGDIFTFYLPFSLRNVVSQNHKNSVIQVTPSINANGKPQIKISFNESNLLFGADPGMLASNVQFPGFTITRNGVSVTNESWLKFSYELNGYNQAMKNLSVPWDTWYETPTYININTTNSNIKQFTPLCNDLILNETTKTTYNVQIDSGNQYTLSVNPEFTNGIIPLCKYQWYVNSQDSITNATAISNATSNVYTVSSDINSSSNITKYYFCKITYWDNGKQLSKTTSLYTFNFSKGSTISK